MSTHRSRTSTPRQRIFVVALGFLATASALPVSAAVTWPDVPLQSSVSVPPNILFILDDSGSMAWATMPGASNNAMPPTTVDTTVAARAYSRNTIYYDPRITYRPWRNADGSFMADTPFTAVFTDANFASGTTANLADLGIAQRRFHVPRSNATDLSNARSYFRYEFTSATAAQRCELPTTGTGTTWTCTAITQFDYTFPGGQTLTRTLADERANFANWYSYHRTRMKVAKAGTSYAFNEIGDNVRVGFRTIWNRNSLDIPVDSDNGLFRGANREDWFGRLFGASASGLTPLRSSLRSAGQYFSSDSASGPWGPGAKETHLACRQNFAIMTTDGYWNSDGSFTEADGDDSNGPVITGPEGQTFQYVPARPYSDGHSNTLADVAMRFWKNDLRPDLPNIVPTSSQNPAFWQHMVTFGISIGLQGTLNPATDVERIRNGTLDWPNPIPTENDTRIDDLLHAAVNSRGTFVAANDPDEFTRGLRDALATIVDRTGSASSVATNSTSFDAGSRIFQATYIGGQWAGDVVSYAVSASGVAATPEWRASALIPAAGSRRIFTRVGTSGAEFLWDNLSTAQRTALGSQAVLNYLRGDRSNERQNGGTLRDRNTVLGDIVHSSPIYSRDTQTLFVGANDGKLHAFNALTGQERFAYVPSNTNWNDLATLSSPTYTHRYFVDGELALSGRVRFSGDTSDKIMLVGALGRGGRGLYALDVTTPSSFEATHVRWERRPTDTGFGNLGNVLGKPLITKVRTGSNTVVDAVIVGNGYNSTNHASSLLVINLQTGAVIREFAVGTGTAASPNGMSTPRGWDVDGDGIVDYIYAGDLQGNLWKFQLFGSNANATPSDWTSSLLFTAVDSGGNRQPITSSPSVAMDPVTYNRWVFFGTGRYISEADPNSKAVQSWYGIISEYITPSSAVLPNTNIPRANLLKRNIITQTTAGGRLVRAFEQGTSADLDGKRGWYVDLVPPAPGTPEGERIVTDNAVIGRILLASSIIPSSDPCDVGGQGFINAIDAFTGAALSNPFFDLNGDGSFDAGDTISDGQGDGSNRVSVGSINLGVRMPSQPALIQNLLVVGGSSGGTGSVGINDPAERGRISWREIVRE